MLLKRLLQGLVGLYGLFVLARSIGRGLAAAGRKNELLRREPREWPFVSIIIPAWRDRAALEACLDTLRQVDYTDYEVIIVAGGEDGTYKVAMAAAAKDARVRAVEQLPRGKNAALNQGLALANAGVVVFLDADSELRPQWLKGLVGALEGDVAASTGNYVPLSETPVSLWGEMAKVYEYQVRGRVILQGSGGIAVRRHALEAIGPFPEERISSDWDLDARMEVCGYRRAFAPDALIRSHRPATLADWWRNELRWRRLHLRSLFRLRAELLADPLSAARHLYPYATSWLAVLFTAGVVLALPFRGVRGSLVPGWSALVAFLLLRETGPVVSVLVYQPSVEWIPLIPATPVMISMTWAACCIASLTRDKAALQFKGARHVNSAT
jgi:cellulose synthase/poly-beta-1,6-N-acetylglucosamine synthase-like glycosyltransferase